MKRASSILFVIVAAMVSLSAAANSVPLIDAVKAGNVEKAKGERTRLIDRLVASPVKPALQAAE